MTGEGFNVGEMAEILKVSTRTVRRDLAEIRESHAVDRDPRVAGRIVGQLLLHAEQAISRLRRVSRERDCPHDSKVQAELGAWGVQRDLVELLQRLGFLPSAVQEIRADLSHSHRFEAAPTFETLEAEVVRLQELGKHGHLDESIRTNLDELQETATRYLMKERLAVIEQKQIAGESPDAAAGTKETPNAGSS